MIIHYYFSYHCYHNEERWREILSSLQHLSTEYSSVKLWSWYRTILYISGSQELDSNVAPQRKPTGCLRPQWRTSQSHGEKCERRPPAVSLQRSTSSHRPWGPWFHSKKRKSSKMICLESVDFSSLFNLMVFHKRFPSLQTTALATIIGFRDIFTTRKHGGSTTTTKKSPSQRWLISFCSWLLVDQLVVNPWFLVTRLGERLDPQRRHHIHPCNVNLGWMSTLVDENCGGSPSSNSNWLLKWYPPK